MFRRIDSPVCRDRHTLQLQEKLQQRPTTSAHLRELIYRSIKRKIGLFAAVEGRFGLLARLPLQVQHRKDLLDGVDLGTGDDAVCLAQRSHDRECRVEQCGLRDLQVAYDELPKRKTSEIAKQSPDEETGKATE
jgi:hypothetical protein